MDTELVNAIRAKELSFDFEELLAAAVGKHKGLSRRGREQCCRAAVGMLPDLIDTRIRGAASQTRLAVPASRCDREPPRVENRPYTTRDARELLLAHGFSCGRIDTIRVWVRQGRLEAVWDRSGQGRGSAYLISPRSLRRLVEGRRLPPRGSYQNPYGPDDSRNANRSTLLDPAPADG